MLERHPYNKVMGDMSPEDFEALKADVAHCGFYDDEVMIYEEKVLDGWQRYRVSLELDIEMFEVEFTGSDDDARRYVETLNRHRRHMSARQRAKLWGRVVVDKSAEELKKLRHEVWIFGMDFLHDEVAGNYGQDKKWESPFDVKQAFITACDAEFDSEFCIRLTNHFYSEVIGPHLLFHDIRDGIRDGSSAELASKQLRD